MFNLIKSILGLHKWHTLKEGSCKFKMANINNLTGSVSVIEGVDTRIKIQYCSKINKLRALIINSFVTQEYDYKTIRNLMGLSKSDVVLLIDKFNNNT